MTHFASRLTSIRLAALVALGTIAGALGLATASTSAATVTGSAPKLVVSFTPAEIGVGDDTGVAYSLTDPNSSGSLFNVSFTDNLPANVTIDNPSGLSTSGCGTPTITATPGTATVSVSAVTIKSGTPCAITLAASGNSAGTGAESTNGFSYSTTATGSSIAVPSGGSTSYTQNATLSVIALPTATIATPKKNAVYTYGQKVKASYSCAAPSDANGPTLTGCAASDDLGNSINSGGALDTTVAGKHSLQVQAFNTLGDVVNAQVNYTVLPSNLVTTPSVKAGLLGSVAVTLKVPGPGLFVFTERHGSTTVGSKRVTVGRAFSALVEHIGLNATGRKLLNASAKSSTKSGKSQAKKPAAKKLIVTLKITYTPKGGRPRSTTKLLVIS